MLSNCTIYQNVATDGVQGIGGVNFGSPGTLINCTVSGNTGSRCGGVNQLVRAANEFVNNIIYGNSSANTNASDFLINHLHDAADDATYIKNIVGLCGELNGNTGCPVWYSSADPLLGTFGTNGGGWPTLPILAGSAAIDSAFDTLAPPVDERGYYRHNQPDIGAFEYMGTPTTGVNAIGQEPVVKVYPNPSTGIFVFSGIRTGATIQLYNVLGEMVYSTVAEGDNYRVNLNANAKGIYFYRVTNNANVVEQGKVVLE